ncbi:MAG: metallophosphoesterase family protein [Saprospiraceae bacterium]
MRQFAISDIHGCASTFKTLLNRINFSTTDELYLLGDYIDRGPDSKGVIDHIWDLQKSGYRVFCLKGNHEEMMVNALTDTHYGNSWLRHGGMETLESFDAYHIKEVPETYITWMRELPHYKEVGNYLLVHAGLNCHEQNPLEDEHAMIWIRRWYQSLDREWLGDRIIVHGHTPIPKTEIIEMAKYLKELPILDIDAGCTFVEEEYGWLCALELGTNELTFQERI